MEPLLADSSSAGFAFLSVVIVSVEVPAVAVVGDTLLGANVATEFLGRPLTARLVAEANPFTEVTVMVITSFLPAFTVPLVDDAARAKSGVPAQTVTETAVDAEAALFASPT